MYALYNSSEIRKTCQLAFASHIIMIAGARSHEISAYLDTAHSSTSKLPRQCGHGALEARTFVPSSIDACLPNVEQSHMPNRRTATAHLPQPSSQVWDQDNHLANMPPKKRARVSQATSPAATDQHKTPTPAAQSPGKTTDDDILNDPWTDEEAIGLFKAIIKWKPTGETSHPRVRYQNTPN